MQKNKVCWHRPSDPSPLMEAEGPLNMLARGALSQPKWSKIMLVPHCNGHVLATSNHGIEHATTDVYILKSCARAVHILDPP